MVTPQKTKEVQAPDRSGNANGEVKPLKSMEIEGEMSKVEGVHNSVEESNKHKWDRKVEGGKWQEGEKSGNGAGVAAG